MAERIAVFGGVYSNHLALGSALADALSRGPVVLLTYIFDFSPG